MKSSDESDVCRLPQDTESGSDPQTRTNWLTRAALTDPILWAAVFLPYLLISLRWVGAVWTPVQDQAVLELRLQDLAHGHVPLLGAFSRYGWSHPGPIWFYALAPFRILGGSPVWTIVGSILLAGAGWATMAVFVRRRFGPVAATVAIGAMVVATLGAGAFTVVIPWNPHLAFAWFPLFLVACLSVAVDGKRDLAAAVLIGSVLIQLHVGYVVLVGVPLTAAVVLSFLAVNLRHLPRTPLRQMSRLAKVLWGLTVLIWVPPVIEQLMHGRDGNLFRLAEFFISPPSGLGAPAGIRFATATLGAGSKVPPIGLGGSSEALEPFSGWVIGGSPLWALLPLALIAGALVSAVRSRRNELVRATVLAGLTWIAGWFALSRIIGDRWPYLFVWRFVLAAFVVAVTGYVIVTVAMGHSKERARPANAALILTTAVVVAGLATWFSLSKWEVGQLLLREHAVQQLLNQIDKSDPVDEPTELVRFGDILAGVGDGVLLGLTDRGWDIGVDESLGFKYGASHVQHHPAKLLLVTEASRDTSIAITMGRFKTLARTTPLNTRDEARITELHVKISRALIQEGRADLLPAVGSSLLALALDDAGISLDADLVNELAELNEHVEQAKTCRCAVVMVEPESSRTPADWLVATATEQ